MKGKLIAYIILMLILVSVLPIFSFAVRDFIEVYNFLPSSFPEQYLKSIVNVKTYMTFFKKADPPNVFSWAMIGLFNYYYLFYILCLFKPKMKYEEQHLYGSHGTARWQTIDETKEYYYKDKIGWFLGSTEDHNVVVDVAIKKSTDSMEDDNAKLKTKKQKDLIYKLGMDAAYHPVSSKLNMQTVVIGPPGSNKTTGFVLPNLYNIPYAYRHSKVKPDIIVTDPKSELYSLTADYFESNGYEVHVLDFIHLMYGDCLNSLEYITTEKELIEIGDGYVRAAGGSLGSQGKNGNDSFWDDAEAQLLSALMGFVKQVYNKPDNIHLQTFTTVAKTLTSPDVADSYKAKDLFERYDIKGAAKQLWDNFLMAEDKVRANIMIGLATKLRLFAIEGIQNITNTTTVDISKLGAKKDKPMVLYLLMPSSDRTFSPIINVTISTILKQLYRTSFNYGSSLYCPVYMLLEEMANIGRIPGINEMLGTMRALKVYPMMIWQSLAQMKERYGENGFEDIMSQCDTHVYLGVNDDFTAEYCSKSLGDTTISVEGVSRSYDGPGSANRVNASSNFHQRRLMNKDEIRKLDYSKSIVVQGHRQPVLFNKVQYKYWQGYNDFLICNGKSVMELNTHRANPVDIDMDLSVNRITHNINDRDTTFNPKIDDYKFTEEVAITDNNEQKDIVIDIDNAEVSFSIDDIDDLKIDDYKTMDF